MPDFNPFVLRRMLALRQFPIFGDADLGELAMLAENVVETTFAPNTVIAAAGCRVSAVHLVLDGQIATEATVPRFWGPRQVFGTLEVLARRELAVPAVTVTQTRTLQLVASDVSEVLEDNFGVLLATLRDLAGRMITRTGPAPRATVPSVQPLGLVERLMVLRQHPLYSAARLDALIALAHVSEETSFPAGAIVTRAGEAATGAYVVIEGELAAKTGGPARTFGPGDEIGSLEMLGELRHTVTIEATTPVRMLATTATTICDVIEDHTDLGLAMIARFAGALLDAPQPN